MKYVIPAVLSLCVGLVLWQLQRDHFDLQYEFIVSQPFPQAVGTSRYFVLRLENSGNKPVTDISVEVVLQGESFSFVEASKPSLAKDLVHEGGRAATVVPLLNPDEVFEMTLTASGRNIGVPTVSARAIGVTATPRRNTKSADYIFLFFVVAPLVFSIYILWEVVGPTKKNRERRERTQKSDEAFQKSDEAFQKLNERIQEVNRLMEESDGTREERKLATEGCKERIDQGAPESEQLIFALLNKAGFGFVFFQMAQVGGTLRYWRTAAVLFGAAMKDDSKRNNCIRALEELTQIEMRPSSLGFSLYLLGKLKQLVDDPVGASAAFTLCREKAPEMYAHLMDYDSDFDLLKISEELSE